MTQYTKLLKQEEIAQDTQVLYLAKPDGFSFKAGQHIDLGLETPFETDDHGSVRTFSIMSAPDEDYIGVAMRMRDTAFKRSLAHLIGAENELSIDGPFGKMTLSHIHERPVVMCAGGIGITPFISMVRHICASDLATRVRVLYSVGTPAQAAYLDELVLLTEDSRIEATPIFTNINEATRSELQAQYPQAQFTRIDTDLLDTTRRDLDDPIWYVAGPPKMTRSLEAMLEEMKVDDNDVRSEEFAGY